MINFSTGREGTKIQVKRNRKKGINSKIIKFVILKVVTSEIPSFKLFDRLRIK